MARSEARIFTHIWTDQDFTHLTVAAQWLYFFLLSQPGLTLCGVIDYHPARWARFNDDLGQDGVLAAADELVTRKFLVIDEGTDEAWIRSLIKNDVARGGPKIITAATRAWATIVSAALRDSILDAIHDHLVDSGQGLPAGAEKGFVKAYRKRYSPDGTSVNAASDRASHTPSEGLSDTPSEGVSDTPSDTPSSHAGTRAPACAQSPAPSPAPSPSPAAADTPSDPQSAHDNRRQANGDGPIDQETETPEQRWQRYQTWQRHPNGPWIGSTPPRPNQTILNDIAAAIRWPEPKLHELRPIWDWALTILDRQYAETVLLRCTDARNASYITAAVRNAALQAGVPEHTIGTPADPSS